MEELRHLAPLHFLAARWRRRAVGRVEERAPAPAAGAGHDLRPSETQMREAGAVAARDLGRLLGAVLLAVLGLVFGLLALLAALAFGVVALAGFMPVWAAGGLGAAALAGLALASARLFRRALGGMETPWRRIPRASDRACECPPDGRRGLMQRVGPRRGEA